MGIENVLAEIPGGDKADEAVLVGAHLDSWHGGTGATDNAANVATLLEAARILAALPIPPRRTVQFAFWDGEELGLAGSRGYVRQHLVHANGEQTAAHSKLSAYFNLDYGAGRIRGVYLQGNARLKPLFGQWLAPIGDGSLIATLRSTLGSDQASFEKIGIPGLSFVQDPLSYEARTHHTNMDDASYVSIDDLRANADVLAAVIQAVANAEAMLPRKGEE
jgi:Zn-dependent M28 family amino/carboxypeptidase